MVVVLSIFAHSVGANGWWGVFHGMSASISGSSVTWHGGDIRVFSLWY